MTISQTFWLVFGVTLVAAGATVFTGRTHRRRLHLILAPVTVALLTVAIVLAEQMGRARAFPEGPMAIHLVFAKTGAALVVPVIVTGLGLLRRPSWRKAHRISVALFLLFVVVASGTGVWVFSLSVPK